VKCAGGPQLHDGRVVGIAKSGGGLLVELVYPPACAVPDRRTTSEYRQPVVGDVVEGAETSCGVP